MAGVGTGEKNAEGWLSRASPPTERITGRGGSPFRICFGVLCAEL